MEGRTSCDAEKPHALRLRGPRRSAARSTASAAQWPCSAGAVRPRRLQPRTPSWPCGSGACAPGGRPLGRAAGWQPLRRCRRSACRGPCWMRGVCAPCAAGVLAKACLCSHTTAALQFSMIRSGMLVQVCHFATQRAPNINQFLWPLFLQWCTPATRTLLWFALNQRWNLLLSCPLDCAHDMEVTTDYPLLLAAWHRVLEVGESASGRRALQLCARQIRRRAYAAWVWWLHAHARPRAALRLAAAAHHQLAARCRAWRVRR